MLLEVLQVGGVVSECLHQMAIQAVMMEETDEDEAQGRAEERVDQVHVIDIFFATKRNSCETTTWVPSWPRQVPTRVHFAFLCPCQLRKAGWVRVTTLCSVYALGQYAALSRCHRPCRSFAHDALLLEMFEEDHPKLQAEPPQAHADPRKKMTPRH